MGRTVAQLDAERNRRKIAFARMVEDALDRLGSTNALVTRSLKRLGFWDDAQPSLALGRYLQFVFGVSFIIDWFDEFKIWKIIPGSAAMWEDKFEGVDVALPGIAAHLNHWGSSMAAPQGGLQSIPELKLGCNFPTGYRPTRTSQRCNKDALSVVDNFESTGFHLEARCDEHEGQIDKYRRGVVRISVLPDWVTKIRSATRYAR